MAGPDDAFEYRFEWDPAKARSNLRKHRVTFERAATIFKDRRALSRPDEEHSQREERWISVGLDRQGSLLVVCHTFEDETAGGAVVRIISARKATRKEAGQYNEA